MKNEEKAKYIVDNWEIFSSLYEDVKITGIRIRKCDNRVQCSIVWNEGKKCSTVARFMLEIKLNVRLNIDETVDHIDGDSTNDSIDNLQLLSRSENSKKGASSLLKQKIYKDISNRMLSSKGDYCRGEKNNFDVLSEKDVREIRELQKTYKKGSGQDKFLAEKYGVCRSTIKAIRLNYSWKHLM